MGRMGGAVIVLGLFLTCHAGSATPTALNSATFDSIVDGSRSVLVLYEAPWCGHCKALHPAWTALAEAFDGSPLIALATVDAEQHAALADQHGVRGFPTIIFHPIRASSGELPPPVQYNGSRAAEDILAFINERTGLTRSLPTLVSIVPVLNASSFHKGLGTAEVALVQFSTAWCDHCKALGPAYEQVARTFRREPTVLIALVDCDASHDVCRKQAVTSYPTLRVHAKGTSVLYEGGRSAAEMVQLVNTRGGLHRAVGGSLGLMVRPPCTVSNGTEAGRSEELDAIVSGFLKLETKGQLDVLSQLQRATEPAAELYVRLVETALRKGSAWVGLEVARVERVLDAEGVSEERADQFVKRRNVLSALL
eukprot:TRINITY_DN12428_c0_g1_i1.p1 TRINITY_DN12428_c0_g1~~TRINITY_DN12428_c0_g1_i1.p1  ORF type:complete len:366 (-),score=66.59 TRINITY_DN12428_c0_g1_i1:173-1270(-)